MKRPTGTCPVCNQLHPLSTKGRMSTHWPRWPGHPKTPMPKEGVPYCKGIGKYPLEEAPNIQLGEN